MIDAKKAGFDSRIIAIALFIGAAVLLGFTIAMNVNFANTIALTDQGKWLRAGSSIGMDCFGALLMVAAGFALSAGNRFLAFCTFLVGVSFMGYTGWNLVGFGATERLGAEHHRNLITKANGDAAKINRDLRTDQAKWMRDTAVETKGEGRKLLIEESNKQIEKAVAPVVVDKMLPPDAQATMMHDMTGANLETVQRIDILVFAILCVIGKSVGFALAPVYWPRKSARVVVENVTAGQSAADRSAGATGKESMVNRPFLQTTSTALSDAKRRALVEEFWAERMEICPNGAVLSDDVHKAYNQWAKDKGVMCMTLTGFGRVITNMSVDRHKGQRQVSYLNVRLKPMAVASASTKETATKRAAA